MLVKSASGASHLPSSHCFLPAYTPTHHSADSAPEARFYHLVNQLPHSFFFFSLKLILFPMSTDIFQWIFTCTSDVSSTNNFYTWTRTLQRGSSLKHKIVSRCSRMRFLWEWGNRWIEWVTLCLEKCRCSLSASVFVLYKCSEDCPTLPM